jgi:branched-chain amino acid transport system permease protein
MPPFDDFKPYFVTGLSLGGVYAMSGVALVVLYRATSVLNLAFGAIGAMGALISWTLINYTSCPDWLAYLVCIAFGGLVTLAYGLVFGPPLARRDPLVKAVGTLGLALILLGIMSNEWPPKSRSMLLPTSNWSYQIGIVQITWTQIIGLGFGVLVTILVGAFLRFTKLGTAMRALANDREITATLGVPPVCCSRTSSRSTRRRSASRS